MGLGERERRHAPKDLCNQLQRRPFTHAAAAIAVSREPAFSTSRVSLAWRPADRWGGHGVSRRFSFPTPLGASSCALAAAALFLLAGASPAFAAESLNVTVLGTGAGIVTGAGIDCGNGAESCEAQFAPKSVITLTALPTERSTFIGWLGCTELPSPTKCRVRIKAESQTDISAEFAPIPQEKLTVVNPGTGLGGGLLSAPEPGPEFLGIRCGEESESCAGEYNQGAVITLTAEPTERSSFNGWEFGDCKSEGGPGDDECMVEMSKARTVKAKFTPVPQQTLDVAIVGSGEGTLTASPGGEFAAIDCGNGASACEAQYNQGAAILLSAERETHSKFVRWIGCPSVLGANEYTASECEVTMSGSKSISAEFASIPQHALDVEVTGPGEITSSPSAIACNTTGGTCTEHFDAEGPESTVTLYAAPPADHRTFWEGCETVSENECAVSLSTARSVKAHFLPNLHMVTVGRTGSGEITSSPSGIACGEDLCDAEFQEGSTVILTAHPAAHNQLRAWGPGECTEEPSPTECEIQIGGSDSSVTAEFTPILHTVSVAVDGAGTVSAGAGSISGCAHGGGVCTGEYDEGSPLVLTAAPSAHSGLPTWSGCRPKPSPAECELTIGAASETVHAVFPPKTQTLTVKASGAGSVGANSGLINGCEASGGVCAGTYIEAATVVLTATPAPHQAVTWSGCTHFEADRCEIEIGPSPSSVKASFSPITHMLTISTSGTGAGRITCNGAPCLASYPEGTVLTLSASPAAGSTFAGWNGAGCSGAGDCEILLEGDTHLIATFNAEHKPPPSEERCVVPPLVGKALARARSALSSAHCSLGRLSKPQRSRGALIVRSSSPSAGTNLPAAGKVNLVLGSKPKKKRRK